jgi:arylsulfatase A-like enzyme
MPQAIAGRADFEMLINAYDGAIAYWDHHLGRLLDKLKALRLDDKTAIIVTADHGEAFGENGIYAEHALAHPPVTRVPLVIFWPGLTEGLAPAARAHDGLFYHLDLGPTLCALLGLPIPAGWHGKSFAPILQGQAMAGRSHLVLSQGVHSFQRAVRMGDLLYIRTLHPGTYKVNPEELYDVARDPHLTRDLMPTESARAVPLKAALSDWWHDYAGVPGAAPDPLQAALQRGPVLYSDPERYLARLEATGRADLAADYRRRLGSFLPDRHSPPAHEKPKKSAR